MWSEKCSSVYRNVDRASWSGACIVYKDAVFYVDLETDGRTTLDAEIWGLSVLVGSEAFLFFERPVQIRERLEHLRDKKLAVFNNLGIEGKLLAREGVSFELTDDPFFMLAILQKHHLGLKDAYMTVINEHADVIRLQEITGPSYDFSKADPNDERTWEYMLQDVVMLKELSLELNRRYEKYLPVYQMDMELSQALSQQTLAGMCVDQEEFHRQVQNVKTEMEEVRQSLVAVFGDINFNSAGQLAKVLIEIGIELPKTKTGRFSAAREVLESIDNVHVQKVIRYRSLVDQMSDLEAFPSYIKEDGRVHPEFKIHATSGAARLYAEKPSITSVPMVIRKAIKPSEGKKFVYVDWSGAEFVTMAYLAKQTDVLDVYRRGEDVILWAANQFDLDGKILDRDQMKVVIYSTSFGSEGYTLSQKYGVPADKARETIESYWRRFDKMDAWKDNMLDIGAKTGMVKTIMGRPRRLNDLFSKEKTVMKKAQRQVINTAIQSSVGDLMREAIVKVVKDLPPECKLVMQVFDSFLFEIPEMMPVTEFVSKAEDTLRTRIGFKFTVGVGSSWYEATTNEIAKRI